jgi:acetolactate synthase I/II/III large subunit
MEASKNVTVVKAAQLIVKCMENEGVEYIFGVPGEENIDIMDALLDSPITFVTTHHEQGAAFMADVYGRLTGRAGVCMSTLGPGATNLITGVADANMDRAPIVAIAGQGATTRLHKESHQILDLVNMFKPITKYSTQILSPEIVPEVVRKAFKVAQTEKPGASFIDFPENIAEMPVDKKPITVQTAYTSVAPDHKIDQAAKIISAAKFPVILAGNGVIRQGAADSLVTFAEVLRIPVANSFMAKGVMPFTHELSLGTIGLKARDLPWFAFEKADVVICVGYDMVEYHPEMWNPNGDKIIVHIDAIPAEVDERYIVEVGVLGDIAVSLKAIALHATPQRATPFKALRKAIFEDRAEFAHDEGFPVKPQKIVWDIREVLGPDDIAISGRAAQYLHHLQRLRLDGDCGAGRDRREARLSRAQGDCRHGRRRFHDEFAGNRNRAADENAVRDTDLERFRIWAHHVAPVAPLRPAQPYLIQESRLREVRRELRCQRLSRREGAGSDSNDETRVRRQYGRHH